MILVLISRPLRPWKVGLATVMGASYLVTMAWPFSRDYFELDLPPVEALAAMAVAGVVGSVGIGVSTYLFDE